MIYLLGHNGFVGSAIATHLKAQNIPFVGIGRDNYDAYKGTKCDILINANGSSYKRLAQENPPLSFEQNALAALRSVFDFPTEKYILISTIDVYNNTTDPEQNHETATIDPLTLSPYGFNKWVTEQVIQRFCPHWLIIRLGGMIGANLKKNSIFDLLTTQSLYVHPDSELVYMHTAEVAHIITRVMDRHNEILNVTGDGTVRLRDVARHRGISLSPELDQLKKERYHINVSKLKAITQVPDSRSAVFKFVDEWQQ